MAGAVACALCCVAFPISRAAADSDFSDFRIPKNRALLWTGGLNARANGQDLSVSTRESSAGDLNAGASTRFQWFSDSDPALTALDVDLAAQGFRQHRTSMTQSVVPTTSTFNADEASEREMFEGVTLTAGHRRYPWAIPLGFEVSVRLSGDYSQRWSSLSAEALTLTPSNRIQTTNEYSSETWRYANSISVSASTGWGRVRNATGIYDALVMERRLLETGALRRPLSGTGRQRLAEVLYLRGALDTVRERPGRVLWREIERVLAEDGALQEGGLDPYSVLRGAEPHLGATDRLTADGVPISPVIRLTGAYVGLRLLDQHANLLERQDVGMFSEVIVDGVSTTGSSSLSGRTSATADDVQGGPVGEIHVPIGPPWQLDAAGAALLGLRKQENQLRVDSYLSLAWLAADRWAATASTSYAWLDDDRTDGPTAEDFWAWSIGIGMGVSWYFEDRTAIELSASHAQQWRRGVAGDPAPSPDSHFYSRRFAASLGVTYRFAGWIATPGFFPAATALPPVRPAQP